MSLFSVAKRNKDFGMGIIERQYVTGGGGGGRSCTQVDCQTPK